MRYRCYAIAVLLSAALAPVSAAVLASGTVTITGTESLTSTLRLYRNGVASTFASAKPFPGTLPCAPTCFFRTVTVTPLEQHVTITISSSDLNVFGSAYLNGFNVANLATNYLGDAGSSGGPESIQVLVPAGQQVVFVVNSVAGLGTLQYTISDQSAGGITPIPSTLILLTIGLMGVASWFALRRRFSPAV
jgi:hypothetical protein